MSTTPARPGGISRRVVVVWTALLALAAIVVALEWQDRVASESEAQQQSARDPRLLVPMPIEQVGVIEVVHEGVVHRFERDSTGAWFYHGVHAAATAAHSHQADPVMAQKIETALEGFDRTRMERKLEGQGVEQYGLANPRMLILVYRAGEVQPLLQVAVGDVAPDTYSRYIMVVGASSVVTIANYQIENLLGLIKTAIDSGQGKATIKTK